MDVPKLLAPPCMPQVGLRREKSMQNYPNMKVYLVAVACALLLVTAPRLASASEKVPPIVWPAAPFSAWVSTQMTWIRLEPRNGSRLSGAVQHGDILQVSKCIPDCKSPRAWVQIGAFGHVPLKILKPLPLAAGAERMSAPMRYFYGKITHRSSVYAAADAKSRVIRHEKAEFRLAFVPNDPLTASGWLQRPDGGFMQKKDVVLFTPSTFSGVHEPKDAAFVFVRRQTKLKQADKKAEPVVFTRYTVLPLLGVQKGKVLVKGGWLPRNLVRVVTSRARPSEIKPGEKWLHVDLSEEVLTAYEGDKLAFATLVSTGKSARSATRTHDGTFKVYAKSVHLSMRGKPWDDYYAEEVPWVMHYDGGRALHGAYWHDQFGIEKSHGCINLAPKDAEWLFAWVPPDLPDGWSAVLPGSAKLQTATVVIEKSGGKRAHKNVVQKSGDKPAPRPASVITAAAIVSAAGQ